MEDKGAQQLLFRDIVLENFINYQELLDNTEKLDDEKIEENIELTE